jgi:PAS domain S-box-containing protein
MKDQFEAKEALIQELVFLRKRISELERSESESKQMVEELREDEEKYRNILENIEDGYFEVDRAGDFTFFNPSICRILGYPREEMSGMNYRAFMDAENAKKVFQAFNEVYVTGIPTKGFEWEVIRKDGARMYIEVSISLIVRQGEKPTRFRGIARDITERKQAEKALRESESLSKSLVDYMHDAMIIMNWDGFILFANRAAARIIDFERPEELTGHNMVEYLHPDSFQKAAEDLEAVKADKMGFLSEYQLSSVTGKHLWVESIGGKIIFRNASANLVCIRDITERKRTEQKLQNTLDSLRKAFGTTIQVMVSAVETRDPYTAGHQRRSADLARAIATEMGLPHEKIEGIRVAGSIHDIGKLSIPAEILSKPTRLTELEFSLIKEHARQGYEMLRDVESPWPLAEIVYQHHERMDGSGYPRSLKGDEIIMEARILAVSDAVESMASHRPYRPAIGLNAALEEIEKNKGILYDADAVDACLRLFREEGFQL